jgi:hypothetical protein
MTYRFKLSRRLASNHRRGLTFAPLLMLLAACGGSSPTGSSGGDATPGWLSVELTTPNGDDGAVQLRITGPGVDSVVASSPYNGFGVASGSTADLVLTGAIQTGRVARFQVSDVSRASQYAVSVTAVAQRGSYALRATSGYQTAVVR